MGNSAISKHEEPSQSSMDSNVFCMQPDASPAAMGNLLNRPMEKVRSIYILGRELGRGQFGITRLCTNRATGEQFACKSIFKRKFAYRDDVEDVRREVQILQYLKGLPNIVELKGVYEDKNAVHLVVELCEGGHLFDRIIAKGKYTERAASGVCRNIVRVIQTCHSMGVMHRDLKPENFLLLNKNEDAPLKIADFRLSVFFKPGQVFTDLVGSKYFVAPEVVRRHYGPEADIWSIGVILYILLSGNQPFWAETGQGVFNAILEGTIDFTRKPWPSISPAAKDLLSKMMNRNPKERIGLQAILNHPWIREDGEAPDISLEDAVVTTLKQFKDMNKLKKLALRVIAGNLSEEDITGLKEMFKSIDVDNSGTVTLEELIKGLAKQGSMLTGYEVCQILEAADIDRNGAIDYMEFITATVHKNEMDKEENLFSAFQYFDKDKSGYITRHELWQALREHNMGDPAGMEDIFVEVDSDQDGRINYEEFAAMMRKSVPVPTRDYRMQRF